MRIFFFITTLMVLTSCGRVYNSSSTDKASYSPRAEGTVQFDAAQAIIIAKCSECHGQWNTFSESDYISNNLVSAQNPSSSAVYYRNQLAAGPQNNMPTSGRPAMTLEELQVVADWINSISL